MKSILRNTNLIWLKKNIFQYEKNNIMETLYGIDRGAINGGMGKVSNAFFEKWKKCPDLGKNDLTVYGLNFSFKIIFYKYLGEKTSTFSTAGSFLHLL